MNVLVTGGAGFLGQSLIAALLARGTLDAGDGPRPVTRILAFDVAPGALVDPRLEYRTGRLETSGAADALVDADTRAAFHLAAVVSGSAEADFDLGMRVNLDGTRALLDRIRALGTAPRVLFTSSIAVFGGDLPEVVTDATTPTPQGSYGVQKLIGELLVGDMTRKGFLDGRSVRVPTVVVRPGAPNGAASGFASAIVREPLAGRDYALPVSLDTAMWMASPQAVVAMLLRAFELPPQAWGWNRALNLPGLTATMGEALDALRAQAGDAVAARVRVEPDERVLRLVRTWASRFDCARARALGFEADPDFAAILRQYRAAHAPGV